MAGCKCTYKGSDNLIDEAKQLVDDGKAVLIRPEVLENLGSPRWPCEIIGDRVIDSEGNDKTEAYRLGAKKALEILKENHVEVVLMKAKSPSCGKGFIYDGTFSHRLVKGDGITCQLLQNHGIIVYSEDEIEDFLKFIEKRL